MQYTHFMWANYGYEIQFYIYFCNIFENARFMQWIQINFIIYIIYMYIYAYIYTMPEIYIYLHSKTNWF